ncbi:MAG: hypothetical protein OHM56_01560 [Spiroplasma phoeniceum]|nr:MAG: hypothetical protein OHM57_00995 [Spiroplasma phoeniceum]UZQ32676.1 MAG: hypothetical protein OHM56_01560 [Spiroplasma phoeniceum]
MKKLLSLLSVLTISGTAVPTTIAASFYPKQEKLNNKINYSEIKNLIRNKRQNNNKNLEINIDFEELETLKDSQVKNIIFDYFNNNVYLQTKKNNTLYKIKENGNLQLIKSGDINGFSLDNNINKNVYIFTTKKLYKNNVYNIEEEISNLNFIYFSLDNENNIILKVNSYGQNIDFLNLIKHDEKENIPQNIDDIYKLRKVYFSKNIDSFNFDKYNNIYLRSFNKLYLLKKYDINPIEISGKFNDDNYTGWKFYALDDDIFIFSDKKLYHLNSGQTSVEEILIPDINDHYLDSEQENFYIETQKGIYKFNIIDQEKEKINDVVASKIAVDKSNNLFISSYDNSYGHLYILLKNEDDSYNKYEIRPGDNRVFNENVEKIFSLNKKIYLFINSGVFQVFSFDRLNEWINIEEQEKNEIEKKANKSEKERIDKERQEWIGQEGGKQAKEWKINKLKEVEEYLKNQEKEGKLNSFGKKILSCLSNHIADGFSLGLGVLGGLIGTAVSPGTGTLYGKETGSAVGKWIGKIVGDAIQEAVPGEKSCKF